MEKMDLSKKVLASLLTMSCVYLGGTSVLPTAGAAENAADNNVGQLITNGGSLTGGDVFNFTSESTANSTALRFYGENLDIPMTGSGVYTINGNGGIISQAYGMVFGSSEDVETGGWGGPSKSFVRATGIINGDWQLNLKADAGESRGIIIDGGTKYINPGSFDSINDASDITFNGKVNIDIEGQGINSIYLNGGAKGTFKDDVNIKGTSNGNNALYGVSILITIQITWEVFLLRKI